LAKVKEQGERKLWHSEPLYSVWKASPHHDLLKEQLACQVPTPLAPVAGAPICLVLCPSGPARLQLHMRQLVHLPSGHARPQLPMGLPIPAPLGSTPLGPQQATAPCGTARFLPHQVPHPLAPPGPRSMGAHRGPTRCSPHWASHPSGLSRTQLCRLMG
jgi:hypothetical protein